MPLSRLFADDIRALREDAAGLVATPERERVSRQAEKAARSALPVLIESEPGSGAQALARAIHDCSERGNRPFTCLHAGEAPAQADPRLISASLKNANGGTLFIGASGFDLAGRVREGRFREDLYYRLQALVISLRPLRAQRDAIAQWAHRLMGRFAADEGKRIRGLSAEAASLLARYDWPGNLRQLENAVYRAVLLAEGPFLTATEFPQIAAGLQGQRIGIPPVPAPRMLAPVHEAEAPARAAPHALSLINDTGEMLTLADLEAQAIRFALLHYQGHMSAISRHLGIGRSTLYRKLKELGLDGEAA
jgi:DNA-binding NtrC family response regulator